MLLDVEAFGAPLLGPLAPSTSAAHPPSQLLPDTSSLLRGPAPIYSEYGEAGEYYGGTAIPLVASLPVGADRLVYYLAQYLQTVGNAYAIEAWQSAMPGPRWLLPIAKAFNTDPEDGEFNETDLPAIFVTRMPGETAKRTQVAEDIRTETGSIRVLWIPPPAEQYKRGRRHQFGYQLAKIFDKYLEDGRNVAWKVPGDTYPTPRYQRLYGSTLKRWTRHQKLFCEGIASVPITIAVDDKPRKYEAWVTTVRYVEQLVLDPQTKGYRPWSGGVGVQLQTDSTPPDPRGPLKTLFEILP